MRERRSTMALCEDDGDDEDDFTWSPVHSVFSGCTENQKDQEGSVHSAVKRTPPLITRSLRPSRGRMRHDRRVL